MLPQPWVSVFYSIRCC